MKFFRPQLPTLLTFASLLCATSAQCPNEPPEGTLPSGCSLTASCLGIECSVTDTADFGVTDVTFGVSSKVEINNCILPFTLEITGAVQAPGGPYTLAQSIPLMENGGGQGDGCEERANAVFPKLEVQKKLFGTGIGVAEVTLEFKLSLESNGRAVEGFVEFLACADTIFKSLGCRKIGDRIPLDLPVDHCGPPGASSLLGGAAGDGQAVVGAPNTVAALVLLPLFFLLLFTLLFRYRERVSHRVRACSSSKTMWCLVNWLASTALLILALFIALSSSWSLIEDFAHMGPFDICFSDDSAGAARCVPLTSLNVSPATTTKIQVVQWLVGVSCFCVSYAWIAATCRLLRPRALRCYCGVRGFKRWDSKPCMQSPSAARLYRLAAPLQLLSFFCCFSSLCLWSAITKDHLHGAFAFQVTYGLPFFLNIPAAFLGPLCAFLALTVRLGVPRFASFRRKPKKQAKPKHKRVASTDQVAPGVNLDGVAIATNSI